MQYNTDTMDENVSEKPLTGSMALSEKLSMSDADRHEKSKRIQEACLQRDFRTLVRLATSTGGLLTDELRQQACMSPLACWLDTARGT